MKILLYCIFTNEYNLLINPWLGTTGKNFYPGKTDILVITDNPDAVKDIPNIKIKIIESCSNRNAELHLKCARHMDILNEYKDSYNFFAAVQANCFIKDKIDEKNFPLPIDKISVFDHTYGYIPQTVTKGVCKLGSNGYRSLIQYDKIYTHAGMTFGPYDLMYRMNKECHSMYTKDYENDRLHCVPYHDESYLNTWRVDNKSLVNILPRTNAGPLKSFEKYATPFYLVDKKDLGIKTNSYVCPKFVDGARLGNHLFLIAACYAQARKNDYDMKMPYKKSLPFSIRKKFSIYGLNDIQGSYKEPTYHYTPIPNKTAGFITGHFQSSKYFNAYKNEIKSLYEEFISDTKEINSAAIHVRMGDYLILSNRYKSPTKNFIERALTKISDNIKKLYIFSDEPERALRLIKTCDGIERFEVIVLHGSEVEDIRNITRCEEFIMSCSSFSWWAAYLGEHKKVIVDKKWYNDDELDDKDVYEDNWIKI